MPFQESLLIKELELRPSKFAAVVLVTDFGDDLAVAECRLALIKAFNETNVIPLEPIIVKDAAQFSRVNAAFNFCRLGAIAPERTIFIGVIDPGVGSQRKSVVIQTEKDHFFVGPDNGIFYPAVSEQGIKTVWQINHHYFPNSSITFHGRDVFTPAAAKIACGITPDSFGQQISPDKLIPLHFQPGQILHIDAYGNLKVFAKIPDNARTLVLTMNDPFPIPVVNTFEDVDIGKPLVYLGSSGLLEIAIREGNAAEYLGLKIEDCLDFNFIFPRLPEYSTLEVE